MPLAEPDQARQPDEIASLFRDALRHSPGAARRHFLKRAGLGVEARTIAEGAFAVVEAMQAQADAVENIVDEVAQTLRWMPEAEIIYVLEGLDGVLELLRQEP